MTAHRWIVMAALAISPAARADSPAEPSQSTDDTATEPTPEPADAERAAKVPVSPDEYDPIADEAKIDSLWQRVDELYARAEEKLAQLIPPAPQR
jgi:hypothetical protein